MPPAAYGAPAIRAANSSARSPANTRWVWLSTKPGITQRPSASIRSSACGARRARSRRPGRPRSPAPRRGRVPSGPSPSAGSFVTSRPMLSSTSELIRSPRRSLPAAHAATSRLTCCPSRTTKLPADDDVAGRRPRRRRTRAASMSCPSARSGQAHAVEVERRRGRRARPARSPRPRASRGSRTRRPSRRTAARRRRGGHARRSRAARRARPRAPPRSGSMTACESLPERERARRRRAAAPPGRSPSARSRSVVGHRQQHAPGAAEQARVGVGDVGGVDRGEALAHSAPAPSSTAVGVPPYAARHSSFSAGCSETCACSGAARSRAHAATTAALSGSTARTLWMAAPIRACGRSSSALDPLGPARPRHRRRSALGPCPARGRCPPCR